MEWLDFPVDNPLEKIYIDNQDIIFDILKFLLHFRDSFSVTDFLSHDPKMQIMIFFKRDFDAYTKFFHIDDSKLQCFLIYGGICVSK